MSTLRASATVDERFPLVRRGYDRSTVDEFLRSSTAQFAALQEQYEVLAAENAALRRRAAQAESHDATERDGLETAAAERLLSEASGRARTIEERARQEFAWRRRQLRSEQDLLNRHKQALLAQLTSLSTLARQTAENLPDVPELALDDLDRPEQAPTPTG